MKQTIPPYLWKIPLCAIAFFIGMAVSGVVLPMLGFRPPEIPAGADANTVALYFLLGSAILSFALSFISRGLRVSWFVRWIILFELTWVFGTVGMVIESFFFMTTGAVSSLLNAVFTLLNFLAPSLLMSAVVASSFRPHHVESFQNRLKAFLVSRKVSGWMWRMGIALLAYPLIYFAFGLMVQPFVSDFYTRGMYELTIPTWGQLIPLQIVRSFFFLLVSLPVTIWWSGSRRGLWLALGFSIFALTAFMAVITAYWFPWQLRFFHGLELLADALIYAGVLILLFGREQAGLERNAGYIPDAILKNQARLQNSRQ